MPGPLFCLSKTAQLLYEFREAECVPFESTIITKTTTPTPKTTTRTTTPNEDIITTY